MNTKTEIKVTSVYDYFEMLMGQTPDEDSLKELPINSPCGLDCVKVINAAKIFLEAADISCTNKIISICNEAIETYWIG